MGLRELPPARACRMGLTFAENARPLCRNSWNIPFHVALLLAVWLTGCNNTCFTFTSNPPTSTIGIKASDPSPSCTLAKANGAIRVQMGTEPACSSCAGFASRLAGVRRGVRLNSETKRVRSEIT